MKVEHIIYNLQRNASGRLILMLSGNRSKYEEIMPEPNTPVTLRVRLRGGLETTLCAKMAKIAINKAWDPADPAEINVWAGALSALFNCPAVDKTGASEHLRKGRKAIARPLGDGRWSIEKY